MIFHLLISPQVLLINMEFSFILFVLTNLVLNNLALSNQQTQYLLKSIVQTVPKSSQLYKPLPRFHFIQYWQNLLKETMSHLQTVS